MFYFFLNTPTNKILNIPSDTSSTEIKLLHQHIIFIFSLAWFQFLFVDFTEGQNEKNYGFGNMQL